MEWLQVKNDGYVRCQSSFYTVADVLDGSVSYEFTPGVNPLIGEIDSGVWAVSYMLSMYPYRPKDFTLFQPPVATVDGKEMPLSELSRLTCYLDRSYPLFSSRRSVRKMVERGLKRSGLSMRAEDVKRLFALDDMRFERPLRQNGNESYRAMAAIGYSFGREVFCFPWFSAKRSKYFQGHFSFLLEVLAREGKTVIFPGSAL